MLPSHQKRSRDLSDDKPESDNSNNSDNKNNDSKSDNKRPRVKIDEEEHHEEEESVICIDDSLLSSPQSPCPPLSCPPSPSSPPLPSPSLPSPQPPATSYPTASYPSSPQLPTTTSTASFPTPPPPSPSPSPSSPSSDTGESSDSDEIWEAVEPPRVNNDEITFVISVKQPSLEVPAVVGPIVYCSDFSDTEDDDEKVEERSPSKLFIPAGHPTFLKHQDAMVAVDDSFNNKYPGEITKVAIEGFSELYVIKCVKRNPRNWQGGRRRDSHELAMNLILVQRRSILEEFCLLAVDVDRQAQCERLLLPLASPLQACWERKSSEGQRLDFIAMSQALQNLHLQGIIHLDVKTLNFVVHNNMIKLIDFEFSHRVKGKKIADGGGVWLKWSTGTIGYLAPEIIDDGSDTFYDEAVEIFALGATFYELVTGRTPVRMDRSAVCGVFGEIILRCVEKMASERPSIAKLLQQLQDLEIK